MRTTNDADTSEHNQSAQARTDPGGLEAASEHREDLEALAKNHLPASKWAQRLLDLLDEQNRHTGRGGDGQ
ncbi:hypothetical protein [Halorubrum trueperi]|uniref:Uncharacterized protein n=1 Tax=Halorubrum trueperi TaxID=2004704 RepID=A0ABD5UMF2_9EURY